MSDGSKAFTAIAIMLSAVVASVGVPALAIIKFAETGITPPHRSGSHRIPAPHSTRHGNHRRRRETHGGNVPRGVTNSTREGAVPPPLADGGSFTCPQHTVEFWESDKRVVMGADD